MSAGAMAVFKRRSLGEGESFEEAMVEARRASKFEMPTTRFRRTRFYRVEPPNEQTGEPFKTRPTELASTAIRQSTRYLLRFCVSCSFIPVIAANSSAANTNSPAADFLKSYLKSPIPVERIIFQTRPLVTDSLLAAHKISKTPTFDRYQTFVGAAQKGDFYLKEIPDEHSVDGKSVVGLFLGVFGSNYWEIVSQDTLVTGSVSKKDLGGQFLNDFNTRKRTLFQVLLLGLPELRDNSLHWQANDFTATDASGALIRGRLRNSEEGWPDLLEFTVHGAEDPLAVELTYSPQQDPLFFPSRFRISQTSRVGVKMPILEVVILSLKFAQNPLLPTELSPQSLTGTNVKQTIIYKEGDYFRLGNDGRLHSMTGHDNVPTGKRTFLLIILWIILVVPVTGFYLFRKKQQN